MRKKTLALVSAALLGGSLLGACNFPGGDAPEIPDLPDQICYELPPGVPGCNIKH